MMNWEQQPIGRKRKLEISKRHQPLVYRLYPSDRLHSNPILGVQSSNLYVPGASAHWVPAEIPICCFERLSPHHRQNTEVAEIVGLPPDAK